MIYVVTSRTALVVIPVLYVLLAFHLGLHRRSLKVIAGYAAVGLAALVIVWATSHHLRARVTVVSRRSTSIWRPAPTPRRERGSNSGSIRCASSATRH